MRLATKCCLGPIAVALALVIATFWYLAPQIPPPCPVFTEKRAGVGVDANGQFTVRNIKVAFNNSDLADLVECACMHKHPWNDRWVLMGTDIDDNGFTRLRSVGRLRMLDVSWTRVTNVGVQALAGHSSLEELNLQGAKGVTGDVIESLANIPNLKSITIGGSGITGGDIRKLATLSTLEFLDISYTHVSASDLHGVEFPSSLRELRCASCNLDDSSLAELIPRISSVQVLALSGNASISIGSVDRISRLRKLRIVTLSGTRIGNEGARRISKSLPECVVVR